MLHYDNVLNINWRMSQGCLADILTSFVPFVCVILQVMTARHCDGAGRFPFVVVAGDHNWKIEEGTEQRRNYTIWLDEHPGYG